MCVLGDVHHTCAERKMAVDVDNFMKSICDWGSRYGCAIGSLWKIEFVPALETMLRDARYGGVSIFQRVEQFFALEQSKLSARGQRSLLLRGCSLSKTEHVSELGRAFSDVILPIVMPDIMRRATFRGSAIRKMTADELFKRLEFWNYPIELCNKRGIVWAFDKRAFTFVSGAVLDGSTTDELVDRLAITVRGGTSKLVIVSYQLPAGVECKTPTPIDAFGEDKFDPRLPCDQSGGRTKPISSGLEPVKEIVHAGVRLEPGLFHFGVGPI
jgi:hypothetical protein